MDDWRDEWSPQTPAAPLNTAIPLAVLTQHTDASSEPTDAFASEGPPTSSAQADKNANPTTPLPSASFLGIPTEIRQMIYGYLWNTPTPLNLYIDPPSYSSPNTILPILQTHPQIRREALDTLRRTRKSLAFTLHASVADLDFSRITALLEDYGAGTTSKKYKLSKALDGITIAGLHILLTVRDEDLKYDSPFASTFEGFFMCLKENFGGLEVKYEYGGTGEGGMGAMNTDLAECVIESKLIRAALSLPWPKEVVLAIRLTKVDT
jgi:hypothetical protein